MNNESGSPITESDIISEGRRYLSEHDIEGADEEALGAAVHLESIVSGEAEDYTMDDLSEYIVATDNFNFGEFIDYKADMATDYSVFADEMEEFLDDVQHLQRKTEVNSALYQAMYEEVKNERDSALDAITRMGDRASEFDLEVPGTGGLDVSPAPEPDIPQGPQMPEEPDTPSGGRTGTGGGGSGGQFSGFGGFPGMWQMQSMSFGPVGYNQDFWSRENIYGGGGSVDSPGDEEPELDWDYENDFFQMNQYQGPLTYSSEWG